MGTWKLHWALTIILLSYVGLTGGQIKISSLPSKVHPSLVRDIHRDHEGYLWIANNSVGLMKHDSHTITRYLHSKSDSSSMSNDGITSIEEDSLNNLWIGTISGLNLYQRKTDNFKRYLNNTNDTTTLSNNYINELYIDNNGALWILTTWGLNKYLPENDNFQNFHIQQKHHSNNFTGMDQDKDGRYWVVTTSNGIYQFIPEKNKFIHFPDEQIEKGSFYSKKILIDSKNNFWIGNWGTGLSKFDTKSQAFRYWPVNENGTGTNKRLIMDILEWKDNQLLLAVDQGGINILNPATEQIRYIKTNDPQHGTLTSNGVYCFHYDREDILWIGTSRGGINYYNPKENFFNTYTNKGVNINLRSGEFNFPIFNIIPNFFEDAEGQIWIGTDGGGLARFNRRTEKFHFFLHDSNDPNSISSNVVRGITEDAEANIYMATWDGGINKFNKETGTFAIENFERLNDGGFHGENLWKIIHDSQNRFWITNPVGQVDLYDEDKNIMGQYFMEPNPETFHMPVIFEDSQKRIYLNKVKGVFEFRENGKFFEKIISLPEVTFINVNDPEYLWIGTQKEGLFLCTRDGKIINNLTTREGLADNYISAIVLDSLLNPWISTHNGLSYYNTKDKTFSNYSMDDGLPGNHFLNQSYLKTKDGEIFFGGVKGFISFYPNRIPQNKTLPEVYITRFYINNQEVDFHNDNAPIDKPVKYVKRINLKHNQRILAFDFQAINFTFSHKGKYRYMLDGYETEWHETTTQNATANYTNLDPGDYTFKVKGANSDGLWNHVPTQIRIIISPPFYKTRAFIILMALAAIFTVLLIIRWRNKKLLIETARLQQKVKERTRVIEKQSEELTEKNKVLEDQKEELLIQHDELVKHEKHLGKLVEERTRDLKLAKEKAEKSDKLKSYFLANMSHEIRTPMNAIVGFATLLGDETMDEWQKSEFIKLIQINADGLLYLMEDILDFSMIEADQMKIHRKKFELNILLDNIFSSFLLQNNNLEIELRKVNELKNQNIVILSDEFRIRQIVFNLLSNATKFTDKGAVELKATAVNDELIISVSDTGPGIPVAEQKNIFSQFFRLENDQYMAKRGIGLGLAISNRLAQLLQARLTLESEVGKGSVFSLSLPGSTITKNATVKGQMPLYALKTDWKGKKLIIIEDENSNFRYLKEVLKPTNINIVWASDGMEALEYFRKGNHFDVALLDIKMPKMDGFETFERIKDLVPNQIIIAQTAYARIEDEIKIRKHGFEDYISKPINPNHLISVISKFL
ncbi:hybrid sensor histidine kinase/response regulator [Marinilabilia sp.]|uniref:hybrid sensor histidine kinase/response regulator n=1 Tax=Marinilabilia sp. TaxID=2021252 RepID=UPI0025C70666|nr:hybrid sensor histidine kinase/response regulator [Marinilabilia sp.]